MYDNEITKTAKPTATATVTAKTNDSPTITAKPTGTATITAKPTGTATVTAKATGSETATAKPYTYLLLVESGVTLQSESAEDFSAEGYGFSI